jgi:hypothetical protein
VASPRSRSAPGPGCRSRSRRPISLWAGPKSSALAAASPPITVPALDPLVSAIQVKGVMTIDYGTDVSTTWITSSLDFPDGTSAPSKGWDARRGLPRGDRPGAPDRGAPPAARHAARRLLGDRDYGTDVREWLNDDVDVAGRRPLGASIGGRTGEGPARQERERDGDLRDSVHSPR